MQRIPYPSREAYNRKFKYRAILQELSKAYEDKDDDTMNKIYTLLVKRE